MEKKAEEQLPEEGKKEAEDEEKLEVQEPEDENDDIDIFSLADVCEYKDGEPLFSKFGFEDWTLLSLRFELHLLAHAYRKDAADPERVGIHETHLPFYYNKYFRKSFNVKFYGVEDNVSLLALIKDTTRVNPILHTIETVLSDDMENFDIFVKLTEQARRERQNRIDAGEETARLKFQRPELPAPMAGVGSRGREDRKGDRAPRSFPSGGHQAPAQYLHHNVRGKGCGPKGAQSQYGLPAMGFPTPVRYDPPVRFDNRKGGGGAFHGGKPGYSAMPPPMIPAGKGGYGPAPMGAAPLHHGQRCGAPYPPPPGYGGFALAPGPRYR